MDSGASNHMNGDATIFLKYTHCHDNTTVRIVDVTLFKVSGIGIVVISKDILLGSVLFVPFGLQSSVY